METWPSKFENLEMSGAEHTNRVNASRTVYTAGAREANGGELAQENDALSSAK
jgi:hypothetical protein